MGIKETLNETKTVVTAIVAVLGLCGTIFGGITYIDNRYAKSNDLQEIRIDVSLIELKDQLRTAQEEYHFLKSQFRKYPHDEDIEEELIIIKDTIKDLKDAIKDLKRKSDG